MKQVTIILGLVLFVLIGTNVNAQIKIPSSLKSKVEETASQVDLSNVDYSSTILEALAPDASLNLSEDQTLSLTKSNETFVSKAMSLINGSGTDEEKTSALSLLQSNQKSTIESLLGETKAAAYYEKVKAKIQPLVAKYAMAKYFM